jgi:hypothetical protein
LKRKGDIKFRFFASLTVREEISAEFSTKTLKFIERIIQINTLRSQKGHNTKQLLLQRWNKFTWQLDEFNWISWKIKTMPNTKRFSTNLNK